MKIEESFSNFYNEIHLGDIATFDSAIKSITKKLNEKFSGKGGGKLVPEGV